MNLAFLDFWSGFRPENNFFLNALRECKANIKVVDARDADLIFFSCFGYTNLNFNHCKKIFFTGENLRPYNYAADHYLSFDLDTYDNKNIRLPLWYLYIDWFNTTTYGEPDWLIPLSYIYGDEVFSTKDKNKFACAVFSNPEQTRLKAVEVINNYKPVQCYGRIHPNKLGNSVKNKLNVLADYRFSLCFENSCYPGYHTEKLLHAKVAGGIPLYYSSDSYSDDFNKNCCINLINYNSLDDYVQDLINIDNDESLYTKIQQEPLFIKKPSLDFVLKQLSQII